MARIGLTALRRTRSSRVRRVSYLGSLLDYEVGLEGGDAVLRVTAPPGTRLGPGERVTLGIPVEACIPLAPDD
jgi:hypothetical protein